MGLRNQVQVSPQNNLAEGPKQILVYPTKIVVTNISAEESQISSKLKRALTEVNRMAKYYDPLWTALIHGHNSSYGQFLIFPRNLYVNDLKNQFPNHTVHYLYNTKYYYNPRHVNDVECKFPPRNSIQEDAQKYLNFKPPFNEGTHHVRALVMQTGLGKTYSTIKYTCDNKLVPIIFVHKETLLQTPWIKDITLMTNIKEEEIAIIQGKQSLDKLNNSEKRYKVYIAIYKTFMSVLDKHGDYQSVNKLYREHGIGVNVFDESHLELKSIFTINSFTRPYQTLYLTATPKRTHYSSDMVFKKIFPHPDKCFGWQSEYRNDPHIDVYVTKHNTQPSTEDVDQQSKRNGVDIKKYFEYLRVSAYDKYISSIQNILKRCSIEKKKYRIAILVASLDMIDEMIITLGDLYPNHKIGNFTSRIKNIEERIKELDSDIILSTEKGLDAGTDFSLDIIINTVPITSDVLLEQIAGRIRKKDKTDARHIFIDLMDVGFPKNRDQLYNKKKAYKKFAKSITIEDSLI